MINSTNPFNPNSVVTPTLFAGRQEQVFQIVNKLSQVREGMPASFVLQGERGIGKTALAKLILHIAEAKDPTLQNLKFLTSYYSVERGQSFESVLQSCLNLMTDRMPESVLSRLANRLGGIFREGKFSFGPFEVNASLSPDRTAATHNEQLLAVKDRAVSVFSNIINGLDDIKDPAQKMEGVLLVIDEIHNISDLGGAAQILRSIATTLDVNQLGKISFLVIGYPEGMDKFFDGDPSAKRHFDRMHLSVMPDEEAKQILIKGFKKAGLKHDEEALNHHIGIAGGYPHSIQIIGHQLIEVNRDDTIDKTDWENAIHSSMIELIGKDFSEMYNFSGKMTLREIVLNFLALAGRPLSKQELSKLTDKKNIYTASCLGQLKKSGAVQEVADGKIYLHSALFRGAILAHIYIHAQENIRYQDIRKKFEAFKNALPEPREI